eukprot:gb/GECG01015530.1/.p1 GENE.gb/GECG01015530.1/~~gb/GECG01015530.1/.p1  ORF type:complete len:219 (+),score=20.35 gb/GECG01015530.1/:1-657(+)
MASKHRNILQRTLEDEGVKIIFTMKNNIIGKLANRNVDIDSLSNILKHRSPLLHENDICSLLSRTLGTTQSLEELSQKTCVLLAVFRVYGHMLCVQRKQFYSSHNMLGVQLYCSRECDFKLCLNLRISNGQVRCWISENTHWIHSHDQVSEWLQRFERGRNCYKAARNVLKQPSNSATQSDNFECEEPSITTSKKRSINRLVQSSTFQENEESHIRLF